MEKSLKILVLFLLYLLLSSRSCDDDTTVTDWQQQKAELAKDSIRMELEVDQLSDEAREAAGLNAIKKLNDLEDYIKIYMDNSIDNVFREKAGEMIRGLFVSEDFSLSFGPVKKNKMQSVTLGEFLEKGAGDDIFRMEVSFDSIRVQEPLRKSGEDVYSGKLAAFQTAIAHFSADSIISPSIPVTIDFISSKQVKIIGQDTLKVWEVKLGDLEVVK